MATRMLQQEYQQQRLALALMSVRQIEEQKLLLAQFEDPESLSWLTESERALFMEMHERHLDEERQILGWVSVDIRRRKPSRRRH